MPDCGMVAARMRAARFLTLIVFLVALVAAWRLWRSPWSASNLEIVPDSVEYAVAADRVATGQGCARRHGTESPGSDDGSSSGREGASRE